MLLAVTCGFWQSFIAKSSLADFFFFFQFPLMKLNQSFLYSFIILLIFIPMSDKKLVLLGRCILLFFFLPRPPLIFSFIFLSRFPADIEYPMLQTEQMTELLQTNSMNPVPVHKAGNLTTTPFNRVTEYCGRKKFKYSLYFFTVLLIS